MNGLVLIALTLLSVAGPCAAMQLCIPLAERRINPNDSKPFIVLAFNRTLLLTSVGI